MSSEQDLLKELLADPAFAELAKKKAQDMGIDLDATPAPDFVPNPLYGGKPRANPNRGGYVYYNEETAMMIKGILDALHANPDSQQFWVSDGIQPSTMYSQWYHGKKYLVDHMDENGFYKTFLQKVRSRKFVNKTQKGIIFQCRSKSVLRPIKLQAIERSPVWRQKIDAFLSEAVPGDKLKMDGLLLTEADQNEVREILENDEKFMYNISPKHVTIFRVLDNDNRKAVKDEGFGLGSTE